MGLLGRKLISGIVWILISLGIGVWGVSLSESTGFMGVLGWIISFMGFGFAVMSISHLFKLVYYYIKGVRMKKEDPEALDKLIRDYENAKKRVQED